MALRARNASQEYWRPANPEVVRLIEPTSRENTCWNCGMGWVVGARFCHVCGSPREARSALATQDTSKEAQPGLRRLGLSVPCLVFFLIGIACFAGAALTGAVYKTDTLIDWQAVQLWRIEWLLGAAAALLAGILLKK